MACPSSHTLSDVDTTFCYKKYCFSELFWLWRYGWYFICMSEWKLPDFNAPIIPGRQSGWCIKREEIVPYIVVIEVNRHGARMEIFEHCLRYQTTIQLWTVIPSLVRPLKSLQYSYKSWELAPFHCLFLSKEAVYLTFCLQEIMFLSYGTWPKIQLCHIFCSLEYVSIFL